MRPLRLVVRLVAALGLLALVIGAVTAVRVVQAGRTDNARQADVLVVLGAAQFDGRPQEYLVARLQHAQRLFDSGTARHVLTLGGKQPGDRFTEAEAGKGWLQDHGVPAGSVVAVGEGTNTLQSVQAAAEVMKHQGWTSAVVVTDPWHELRSTTMLRDQGVTVYGSPTPTGPSHGGAWVVGRYVARETVAYVAYVIGRVLP
ncbi:MAG TPA: YdcF family protein [Actinomycetales bacterium]|nr:YdcF family protein [Actinomycetales bacterium]